VRIVSRDVKRRKEVDENEVRIDFSPDETLRIIEKFEPILSEEKHGKNQHTESASADSAEAVSGQETRVALAEMTGWSHDSQ
jgi:hypothetical protein